MRVCDVLCAIRGVIGEVIALMCPFLVAAVVVVAVVVAAVVVVAVVAVVVAAFVGAVVAVVVVAGSTCSKARPITVARQGQ